VSEPDPVNQTAPPPPSGANSPFRRSLKPTPGPSPVEYVIDGWPPFFDWPPQWWRQWREGKGRTERPS